MAVPTLADTAIESLTFSGHVILFILSTIVAISLTVTALYVTFWLAGAKTNDKDSDRFALVVISGTVTATAHVVVTLMMLDYDIPYHVVVAHVLVRIGSFVAAIFVAGWSVALVVKGFSYILLANTVSPVQGSAEGPDKKTDDDTVVVEHPKESKKSN